MGAHESAPGLISLRRLCGQLVPDLLADGQAGNRHDVPAELCEMSDVLTADERHGARAQRSSGKPRPRALTSSSLRLSAMSRNAIDH